MRTHHLALTFLILSNFAYAHTDDTTIEVEHSFDGRIWTPRGSLKLKRGDTGLFVESQEANLAPPQNAPFYFIRTKLQQNYLISSAPLCSVIEGQPSIVLSLLDGNFLTSLDLVPAHRTCASPTPKTSRLITPRVQIISPAFGVNPTKQQISQEQPQEQNQDTGMFSMITRNWMYIVPAVLVISVFNVLAGGKD